MKRESTKIGNLEAKKGEKVFGFIDAKDGFGTISQLPVGIINGTEEGATLLITAGVHACEYASIEAVTRLYKETKPEGLKGTVIAITCMNLPAFRMCTPFVVPLDKRNLARSFPGSPNGSAAEVIAHIVMNEILPKADYMVDCHGGDIGEKPFPITICYQTDHESINERSKELANAFGLDYCFYSDPRTGGDDNYWPPEANRAGVPAIQSEAGGDGQCEETDVEVHIRGLKNVMRYLRMIPGRIQRESDKAQTTYFRCLLLIKTGATGIFSPLAKIRERVSKGQIVAEIRDLKGEIIKQVKSPDDCMLLLIMTKRIVNSGDTLFYAFKSEE